MAPRSAPRPLAELAALAGAKAFARYGFTEQRLITHWTAIAGETLGRMTVPIRLSQPRSAKERGGVLRVMAEGPAALELQHLAPVVIERINGVFGYPAVASLSIVQGKVAPCLDFRPPPVPPDPEADAVVAKMVAPISDEALKKSLIRLGRAVRARWRS